MRVSTAQIHNNQTQHMSRMTAQLNKIQEQIASGKKINRPSDDPRGYANITSLKSQIAKNDQYNKNIDSSVRRLNLQENTLKSVFQNTLNLKDIANTSTNPTLSNSELKTMANEVDGILNQLLSSMNTQDYQGEYLFSGHQGNTTPYSFDNNKYVFNGDQGTRSVPISDNHVIQATDSGLSLFLTDDDNILNIALELKESLQTVDMNSPASRNDFYSNMNQLLTKLDNSVDSLNQGQGRVGHRITILEQQKEANNELNLMTKSTLSMIEDTSYEEAISQFMLQKTALEAAFATFSKTSELSLFNFLRG